MNAFDLESDFGDGCNNEFQRAFEVSRMNTPRIDISGKIAELVKAGRFVVTTNDLVYCRYTDAVIGAQESIAGDYATYAEALAKAEDVHLYGDGNVSIYPNPNAPVFTAQNAENDLVPF